MTFQRYNNLSNYCKEIIGMVINDYSKLTANFMHKYARRLYGFWSVLWGIKNAFMEYDSTKYLA